MTTGTITPYRSQARPGHDGFWLLLRAEWTKFRSVRGWVIAMAVLVVVTAGLLLIGRDECSHGNSACTVPLGPGGEAVNDSYYLVRQPLDGNGSLTVRVTSLTGLIQAGPSPDHVRAGSGAQTANLRSGVAPWAKAGIILEPDTAPGTAYAAMMATGAHGVRMQYDYTGDIAGLPGQVGPTAPRWLRLVRSGDVISGYDSADGTHWTRVGTVTLPGLPATVQAGMFATSPSYWQTAGQSGTGGPTLATGVFDRVGRAGSWPDASWTGTDIGADAMYPQLPGGFRPEGGTLRVTGSGDIAPDIPGSGGGGGLNISFALLGTFAGLVVAVVVGAMFITAEYRRGLIRTTLAAAPRRGQVLLAKAVVVGLVTFCFGLVAATAALAVGVRSLRQGGSFIDPVSTLTEVRLVAGTAALLAVAAILALAVGIVARRSAAAVTIAIMGIVAPWMLSTLLSQGAARWLLAITPAAGFAIQQAYPRYPQTSIDYATDRAYGPLVPWAGFAVLCAWTLAALALALFLLRRRDA
jgi:ABC-type transport system involved in multi-copper enzyme maturation permease subunit